MKASSLALHLFSLFLGLSSFSLRAQPMVVPEIQGIPVRSVVISSSLFTYYQNTELFNVLFQADVPEVIIMAPRDWPSLRISGTDLLVQHQEGDAIQRIPIQKRENQRLTILRHDASMAAQREPSAWARDWGPLTQILEDGSPQFISFRYMDKFPLDQLAIGRLAGSVLPDQWIPIQQSNQVFEGGNFLIDEEGYCAVSDSLLKKNRRRPDRPRVGEDRDTLQNFKATTGCKTIDDFASLPFEQTQHLDLWMKFVGKKRVLMSYLPKTLQKLPMYQSREQQAAFERVRTFLQDQAVKFTNAGWTVIPVPMAAPVFFPGARTSAIETGMYRSYVNSLIVNNQVVVPRYINPIPTTRSFEPDLGPNIQGVYPDNEHLAELEEIVQRSYEAAGFDGIHWARADLFAEEGGAIHCVTMQIPEIQR